MFGAISCKASSNGVDQICVTSNKNGKITAVNYCYVDKDEKSVCIKVYSSATGPDIPADLRDAAGLRDAPGLSDSSDVAPGDIQNETKVPKTGILNDGGLLKDDNTGSNNTSQLE